MARSPTPTLALLDAAVGELEAAATRAARTAVCVCMLLGAFEVGLADLRLVHERL